MKLLFFLPALGAVLMSLSTTIVAVNAQLLRRTARRRIARQGQPSNHAESTTGCSLTGPTVRSRRWVGAGILPQASLPYMETTALAVSSKYLTRLLVRGS
jgi:hypothetical protein